MRASDNYVHNHMNFGNFLWGAAGYSLGFNEFELRTMAHLYTIYKHREFDSTDDQLSISRGVNFSKVNNYRSIKKTPPANNSH